MPGKKQQYQGALDSVYNIVFSQASKPPSKKGGGEWAKKIPGDPMSFALTEMVAKPWLFWGNTVKEIADGLHDNVKLSNFWNFSPGFDSVAKAKIASQKSTQFKNIDATTGEAKLSRSDITQYKFWQSPLKYAESVFESTYEKYKEERKKFALAGLLGGAMDWVVGYGYASKLGLSPSEKLSFAGASGYFTQGVGHYSQRLKMKAENAAMAIGVVNSRASADNYSRIIKEALDASKLGAYYTADMNLRYNPAATDINPKTGLPQIIENNEEIDRRRAIFRNQLRVRLTAAHAAGGIDLGGIPSVTNALLEEIERNYFKEVGLFGHDETKAGSYVGTKMVFEKAILSDMAFSPGALRETIIRNREMRIKVLQKELEIEYASPTPRRVVIDSILADLEKVTREREFTHALQLIKGDYEDYAFDFYQSIERIDDMIASNRANAPLVASLESARGEIMRQKDAFMTSRKNNPIRMRTRAGSGRSAVTAFAPNLEQKTARKAVQIEIDARLAILNSQRASRIAALGIGVTPADDAEISKIDSEIRSLYDTRNRIESLRGTSFKNIIGNTIVSYNYAKMLLNGKIYTMGNVFNGFVFWKFGVFSPGARVDFSWKNINNKFEWDKLSLSNPQNLFGKNEVKMIVMPREFCEIGYLRYMTDLFYLRPGTIMNTLLYNGEGFAYLAARYRERVVGSMVKKMGAMYDPAGRFDPLSQTFMLLTGVRPNEVVDKYQLEGAVSSHFEDFFTLLRDDKLIDIINEFAALEAMTPGSIATLFANPSLIANPVLQAKVVNLLNLFKSFGRSNTEAASLIRDLLTNPNVVNFIYRLRTSPSMINLFKLVDRGTNAANAAFKVQGFFKSNVDKFFMTLFGKIKYDSKTDKLDILSKGLFGIGKFYAKASEKILGALFKDAGWKTSVRQFIGKELSLNGVISEVVRRVLGAIGLGSKAAGPPGWVVAFITWVASLFVDKIVKVAMKLPIKLANALWGVLLLFFAITIGCSGNAFSTSTPNGTNDPTSTEVVSKDIDLTGYGEFTEDYIGELGNAKVTAYGNEDPLPEYFFSEYSCMLNTSATCAQGSISVSGYSHYHGGKPYSAIDVTPGNYTILAPAEGRVTYYKPVNNCGKTGISYGGHLQYTTIKGDVFVMYHVKLVDGISVNSPDNIQAGEVIAILNTGLAESDCWTGPHAHIEVKSISTNYRYQCPEEFFYGVCDKMGQCKLSGDICKRKDDYK